MKKVMVGGIAVAFGLLCIIGLALSPQAAADQSATATASPATATEGVEQAGGTAVFNWVDIANATGLPDGTFATHIMEDSGGWGNMHSISFTSFGFNIPANVTSIDGFELNIAADVLTPAAGTGSNVFGISRDAVNAYTGDQSAITIAGNSPLCDTGVYGGTPFADKAALAALCSPVALSGFETGFAEWPHDGTGLAGLTRGGPTNDWGANQADGTGMPTPTEINAAGFGIVHMARSAAPGDTFTIDGMTLTVFYTTNSVESTISRNGAFDDPFELGAGSWTIVFDEDVDNVTDDDFSVTIVDGDLLIGTGPTVAVSRLSGSSFDVSISGVIVNDTSIEATIRLNFDGGDVVASGDATATATPVSSDTFSDFTTGEIVLPAAKGWALIFVGVMLALAAAVVIRKTAMEH